MENSGSGQNISAIRTPSSNNSEKDVDAQLKNLKINDIYKNSSSEQSEESPSPNDFKKNTNSKKKKKSKESGVTSEAGSACNNQ